MFNPIWYCTYETQDGCYYFADKDIKIVCSTLEKFFTKLNLTWERKEVLNANKELCSILYRPNDSDDGWISIRPR